MKMTVGQKSLFTCYWQNQEYIEYQHYRKWVHKFIHSGRGFMEEGSWKRAHGRGLMEEGSWKRDHGIGLMEEGSWNRFLA